MRPSHPDPEVESYLKKAERDLATASRMSESGSDFADIVCFHAEQCAEKSLKGLILALGETPPRSHDLVLLQKNLREIDDTIDYFETNCLVLADYAVSPRYPGWEDLVGIVDLMEIRKAAEAILSRVLARLGLESK
jgi:HEPN domain-containing protein